MPIKIIQKLQLAECGGQGAAIQSHITAILKELNWLPVIFWVQFKVVKLRFKALNGLEHKYRPACVSRSTEEAIPVVLELNDLYSVWAHGRAFLVVASHLCNEPSHNIVFVQTPGKNPPFFAGPSVANELSHFNCISNYTCVIYKNNFNMLVYYALCF